MPDSQASWGAADRKRPGSSVGVHYSSGPFAPLVPWLRGVRLYLGAFGLTLTLYLLTTSYVIARRDGGSEIPLSLKPYWVFRSYHLLQSALYKLVFFCWQGLGYRGPDCVPVHVFNCVVGAVAATLLLIVFRRFRMRLGVAATAASLWALSFTPWYHSRSGDTGMTPMPLLLGMLLILMPKAPVGMKSAAVRVAGACVFFSLSVCFSLNMVLLFPALLMAVAQMPIQKRRLWPLIAIGLLTLTVFGLGPFIAVAVYQGDTTPQLFLRWLTFHPEAQGLKGGLSGLMRLPRALSGISRLVFPPSAGETATKALLVSSTRVRVELNDFLTLGRNLGASILLVLAASRGWWVRRKTREGRLITATIPVTGIFCLVWLGSDAQFWLPIYPFLLALAAFGAEPYLYSNRARKVVIGGAAVITTLLLFSNYDSDSPSPLTPRGGYAWQASAHAAEWLTQRDMLFIPDGSPLVVTRFFRPELKVINLTNSFPVILKRQDFLNTIRGLMDEALTHNGRVYIEALREPVSATMHGFWELTEGKHEVSRAELASFLDQQYQCVPAPDLGPDVEEVRLRPRALMQSGSSSSP